MIGPFRQRLIIEKPVLTPDSGGGQATVWQSLADAPAVWGKIAHASAENMRTLSRAEHMITHKISLRYRNDILPTYRLRKGNRIFYVRSLLQPDERSRFLEILVEERPN